MNLPAHIKTILEAAILAPSGENAQPWRFIISDNQIQLFNVPERDQSYYNYGQLGSYVAHGAAIENMVTAAAETGYRTDVKLFPPSSDKDLVAEIKLTSDGNIKPDSLYPYTKTRVSNRKPYHKTSLTGAQKREIESLQSFGHAKLFITDDRAKIGELAVVGATNERVMLETKEVHNFFFSHLNWTEREELEKRYGFYIKTLELPPLAKILFRLFKHWPIMRLFNAIGFPKLVVKGNTQLYTTASAMIVITTDSNTKEEYVEAGRLTERFWLTATKLGLAVQPLTGTLFFNQKIRGDGGIGFSLGQIDLLKEKYACAQKTFNLENENIAMMFRVGFADIPSARASRRLEKDFLMSP